MKLGAGRAYPKPPKIVKITETPTTHCTYFTFKTHCHGETPRCTQKHPTWVYVVAQSEVPGGRMEQAENPTTPQQSLNVQTPHNALHMFDIRNHI